MEEHIVQFPKQFAWEPHIENEEKLPVVAEYLLCGMGGSHLGAQLLLRGDASLPLRIHSDYGLPPAMAHAFEDTLIIISSYSGETEETLDALSVALDAHLPVVVITSGGTLLVRARELHLPLCVLPQEDIQPRMALGYQMLALARVMKQEKLLAAIRSAGSAIDLGELSARGSELASHIAGHIPVFYASTQNAGIAYYMKIILNETGKMPAFCASIPEACHNELSGYEVGSVPSGAQALAGIFIQDPEDDVRVTKRMQIATEMLQARSIATFSFPLTDTSSMQKVFESALIASYAGVILARARNVPDTDVPLITEFKKKMKEL